MRPQGPAPFCPILDGSYSGKKRDVTPKVKEGEEVQQDETFYVSYIEHFGKNNPRFFSRGHLSYPGYPEGATGI